MRELPAGTVTFLFTDVEGSTKLLHELGAVAYDAALIEHRRILREAFAAHGGIEVDTQGDAFFYAFPDAQRALEAAGEGQEALSAGPIAVRMGVHTGTPHIGKEGYIGDDVHLGARIAASAHGGQVVCSKATVERASDNLSLTELGEHRLKDIPDAVAIYQLGAGSFAPLKTISNTNLPRPASSFVGREDELLEVLSRLEHGARLVTLTGPGGTGKTRLAIEAASELVPDVKAGVFWVGLASLRDPALVTETITQTLGAKDGLAEHIAEREMLLLVDNLEQVIDCAPELAGLLEACPNLTLLATSRELLRIRGEVEYAVPPLSDQEAVSLFCERSQLEADGTIAELCRRLDDLPLAVELAAARTSALTPAQILGRVSSRLDLLKGGRDAEARQQTLRATIEWSYELLGETEQQLFARLSVFAGGCTLEAAEAVCDADLDTLQSLVEKSLLRFTDGRYWMLETIRAFADERLDEGVDALAWRLRHAEHFLVFAEAAEPNVLRMPAVWLDRFESEHGNLRAALDFFESQGQTELALRLAAASGRFWYMRGHVAEGRRRIDTALGTDERPSVARGRALNASASLDLEAGDAQAARVRAEEALAVNEHVGSTWQAAHSVLLLGHAVADCGDFVRARQLFEDCLSRFRDLGDDHYTLLSMRLLAWPCDELGERERARELYEDVARGARELQNDRMEAMALGALAGYAVDDGRFSDAASMLKTSTATWLGILEVGELALNLCRIARLLAAEGRASAAARVLACAEVSFREAGIGSRTWLTAMNEETLAAIREQLDEATLLEDRASGCAMTVDQGVTLALASLD